MGARSGGSMGAHRGGSMGWGGAIVGAHRPSPYGGAAFFGLAPPPPPYKYFCMCPWD